MRTNTTPADERIENGREALRAMVEEAERMLDHIDECESDAEQNEPADIMRATLECVDASESVSLLLGMVEDMREALDFPISA